MNEHPEASKLLFDIVLQVASAVYANREKNEWKTEGLGKTFGSFLNHKFYRYRYPASFNLDNPLLGGPVSGHNFAIFTHIIELYGSKIRLENNKLVFHP